MKFQDSFLHHSPPYSLDASHTGLSCFQTHLAHAWSPDFALAVLSPRRNLSPDAHVSNFSILCRLSPMPPSPKGLFWSPSLKQSFCHLSFSFFFSCNIFCYFKFYCCSSTVLCLFPQPQTSHLPPISTVPSPAIVHVSFIIVPTNPSPFSPVIPSPVPSGHCQSVLNFSVFGYNWRALC